MTGRSALFIEPLDTAHRRLEETVRSLQADDPLSPLTVIVPSTYAGLALRRDLGRGGLANARFIVPARLAELLGAPALSGRGLRPLTSLVEGAAVRRAAAAASGPLEAFRYHRSFHLSLRATFRELRYAGDEALAYLEARGGLRREVVRLYRRYREHTAAYYDREALALSAAGAVASGSAPGLSGLGPVVFYLVREPTAGERTLIEALASHWSCTVILGVTGDASADAAVRRLAERLEGILERAGEPPAPDPAAGVDSRLLIAPDAREEVRWIARSIASEAARGNPFHRMAVLFRHRDPYASLVSGELKLAGIPVSGPSAETLGDSAAGRTLNGLLRLTGGDLSRDEVMEWLTSCPVAPPETPEEAFRPSEWDALSRSAGVVRGVAQWQERLEHYARQMERHARDETEERAEAAAARLTGAAEGARALSAFMEGLHRRLQPPDEGRPWSDFAGWGQELLDAYLGDRSGALPDDEQANLDALRAGLRDIGELDRLGEGATLEGFRMALDDLLSSPVEQHGRFGEGVFVAPLAAATGLRFDRVYVIGMVEGVLPPPSGDDPLVPDRERFRAGGSEAGLPLHGERVADERYRYLAALASAPSRVFAFPRGDLQSQRARHPSRWFLEEASRLSGSPVYATSMDSLASLGGQPWLVAVASPEDALRTLHGVGPADLHDYDLHRLWHWQASGHAVGEHHLAASDGRLARALDLERRRSGRELTRWDGDVSAIAGRARRLRLTDRPVLSASGLQDWATCPFRYFLSHVLGIAALEQPEEISVISALERGSLVHTVLERFMREIAERDWMPEPGEPWTGDHSGLLTAIARQAFHEAEARGVTGKPLLWELAQVEMLEDLRAFLDEDSRLRRQYGVTPREVELRFGFGGERRSDGQDALAAECPVPGVGTLRFRGVIDRLDLDPSGGRALVLDYKTGRAGGYDGMKGDPVDRGRRVQLPVYGLAARRLLGSRASISVAYWFVTARGGFVMRPETPVALDDLVERFRETLAVVAQGIQGGLFPAVPGVKAAGPMENCRNCDFDSLCPARRVVHWDRKREDPRLSAYVGLAAPASESEAG